MSIHNQNSKIVYSTDHGNMCPTCSKQIKKCTCRNINKTKKTDGIIRVGRSTKGRKGKGVTIITGLPIPANDLKNLTKKLKQRIGAGGTVKNGMIEIQGDHRSIVVEELKKIGYTAKLSGG